jgi:hypothetical protein
MMRDPDLTRAPTSGHFRSLELPSGGSLEIPLPSSKQTRITVKPPKGLGESVHESKLPLIIGVAVGVAIGVGATYWILRRR